MNKTKLVPLNVDGYDIALISEDLPEYIKDIIINNYDKSSSGLGSHYYMSDWDRDYSPQ
tara:strand:- start:2409 stop:2585 length:177 start_codon:yes stop_codon:yes gene_type:complete